MRSLAVATDPGEFAERCLSLVDEGAGFSDLIDQIAAVQESTSPEYRDAVASVGALALRVRRIDGTPG